MHVAPAPRFDHRHSVSIFVLASIKPRKAKRNDETDLIKLYRSKLDVFLGCISSRTLGKRYFELTNQCVPNTLMIDRVSTYGEYTMRGGITGPVGISTQNLESIVADEWQKSSISSDVLFFHSTAHRRTQLIHLDSEPTPRPSWWRRTFGDESDDCDISSAAPVVMMHGGRRPNPRM